MVGEEVAYELVRAVRQVTEGEEGGERGESGERRVGWEMLWAREKRPAGLDDREEKGKVDADADGIGYGVVHGMPDGVAG